MTRALVSSLSLLLVLGLGIASAQDKKQPEKPKDKEILGKTVGEWIKILREHEDPKLRWAAVKVLDIADTSNTGLPAIFDAAEKDKDATVRIEALRVIGRLDPKTRSTGPKALVWSLQNDKEGIVREAAANALGGPKIIKAAEDYLGELAGALKDEHAGTRIAVATTLRNMGEAAKPAVPALLEAARNPKEHTLVRTAAIHVVSRHGKDNSKTLLLMIDLAKNPDNAVALREIALEGLGRSGSDATEVVTVLCDTLADKSLELRKAAAVSLGALGTKAKTGWPTIKTHAANPKTDSSVRNHLIRLTGVLGKNNSEAIDILVSAAKDDDSTENRIAAIQELGELGSHARSAVKTLSTIALQDGRAAVRDAASKAVKNITSQ